MTGGAANRKRGDYLERTTKAALEGHGWLVTRAAGSHGAWDLMAMRAGRNLLVQCKTDGRIGPADRTYLVAASELAGARPVLAWRPSRGVIQLDLVDLDGHWPWDTLKAS